MESSPRIQFPDGPPIPEMREALLNPDSFRELISDLTQFTRVHAVQCKTRSQTQTPQATNLSLEQAADLLLNGAFQAIQIKYFHENYEWTDTLLSLPQGIRLVRCRHDT